MRLIFTDSVQQSGFKDIQILRATTIYDHRYGEVKVTPEMLEQMVRNFDEKVRGVEIMLDAGHNSDKEAYGWFKTLYTKLGEDNKLELWATVELTSLGQRSLTEKLYGYVSADFDMSYQDNETLKKYGAVLLGAGLTNRPVVKKMKPAIELAENNNGVKFMEIEELLKLCNVSSPEELIKMVQDMRAKGESDEMEMKEMKTKVEMSESKVKELEGKITLSEKEKEFNVLLSEGKVVEAQRVSFMDSNMVEFAKHAQVIKLDELSKANQNGDMGNEDAEEKILELAEKKVKEDKMPMAQAIQVVLSENKELAKKYRKGE